MHQVVEGRCTLQVKILQCGRWRPNCCETHCKSPSRHNPFNLFWCNLSCFLGRKVNSLFKHHSRWKPQKAYPPTYQRAHHGVPIVCQLFQPFRGNFYARLTLGIVVIYGTQRVKVCLINWSTAWSTAIICWEVSHLPFVRYRSCMHNSSGGQTGNATPLATGP